MRCGVTGLAALSLLVAAPALAAEEGVPVLGPAHQETARHEARAQALFVGLHYDQGFASAFGVSALHVWERDSGSGLEAYHQWVGLGVDGRVATRGFHGIDGALGYGVGRWSAFGHAGGLGLELAAGVGGDARRAFPAAAPGVFLGVYYFEVGYAYQFPFPTFERPAWLSSHQFSLRVHVPVARYAQRAWGGPPVHTTTP